MSIDTSVGLSRVSECRLTPVSGGCACGGDGTRATAEEADDAAPRPQGAYSQIFLIFTCVRCLSPPGSGTHHPRFRGSGFRGSPGAVAEVPGSRFRPSRERRGWVFSGQGGGKLRTGSEVPGSEGGTEPRTR